MQGLDAIGDRNLRTTLLFVREQQGAVTADEVAAAHRIHRNVARARLERLVEAGLLLPSFERRTGRTGPGAGRPAKMYRVAPELSSIEFPRRYYERLVGLVTDKLPKRDRTEALHEVGIAFGGELARQAHLPRAKLVDRAALERTCAALGALGYQASIAEVKAGTAVLTTPTCPLRPLVRAHPQLEALDRGMWAGLVASAFRRSEGRTVVCHAAYGCHSDDADCRVHLTLERPARF